MLFHSKIMTKTLGGDMSESDEMCKKCLTEECNGNCNPTVSAGYCFEDWWRLEVHKLWKEFAPDGEKFPDSAPAVVQRKIAERAFLAGLQSKA